MSTIKFKDINLDFFCHIIRIIMYLVPRIALVFSRWMVHIMSISVPTSKVVRLRLIRFVVVLIIPRTIKNVTNVFRFRPPRFMGPIRLFKSRVFKLMTESIGLGPPIWTLLELATLCTHWDKWDSSFYSNFVTLSWIPSKEFWKPVMVCWKPCTWSFTPWVHCWIFLPPFWSDFLSSSHLAFHFLAHSKYHH